MVTFKHIFFMVVLFYILDFFAIRLFKLFQKNCIVKKLKNLKLEFVAFKILWAYDVRLGESLSNVKLSYTIILKGRKKKRRG